MMAHRSQQLEMIFDGYFSGLSMREVSLDELARINQELKQFTSTHRESVHDKDVSGPTVLPYHPQSNVRNGGIHWHLGLISMSSFYKNDAVFWSDD